MKTAKQAFKRSNHVQNISRGLKAWFQKSVERKQANDAPARSLYEKALTEDAFKQQVVSHT